jgi:ABC-2 type transport system permease protein
MFAKIAAFELRYQLRAPLFYVSFAIFFLLAFGSVTNDNIRIGGGANVNLNSPFALMQTSAIMALFGIFVAAAFVANVVIRDDETGFAGIIHSTRMSKFDYLIGRFCGAYLVGVLVVCAAPLGILIGVQMPWVDSEKVGPFVLQHYVYAVLVFIVPSMLVMSTLFFSVASWTRSMMWTYMAVIAFMVLYITSRVLLRDPAYDMISALADPTGLAAWSQDTRYWTATERNSLPPALDGVLRNNRLFWFAVGLALLALAFFSFRFERKSGKTTKPSIDSAEKPVAIGALLASTKSTPQGSASMASLFALTRFEFAYVFKSPAFLVLLVMGLFNAYGSLIGTSQQRNIPTFPLTSAVIDALTGSFSLIGMIVAAFYAGDLIWRNRDRKFHEVVDATATANWVFLVPKVMAITLVLFASYGAAALLGVAFQLFHGFKPIAIGSYFVWFLFPSLISAFLIAVLALFVQTLVPHKAAGWAVMLLYVVASVGLVTAGFEHNLYSYAGAPEVPLSDMNGIGHFWQGRAWFHVYWLAFSLVLLILTHWLWRRGTDTQLSVRLKRLPVFIRGRTGIVFVLSLLGFFGLGGWIFHNTNQLNVYKTTDSKEALLAKTEKALVQFEKMPRPKIIHVDLAVDLFPSQRRATTKGSYIIENRSSQPMKETLVGWMDDLNMVSLQIPGAKLKQEFKELNYRLYEFDPPLQVAEKRTINFETLLLETGFKNAGAQTRIVDNGSFISNFMVSPLLFYKAGDLQERSKRRKYGLPPDVRPPKLEDKQANQLHYLRGDSDWVSANLSLTTDADQVPVLPGVLVSDTTAGQRRTLKTKTDQPIQHFFSMQSARFAQKHALWQGKEGKPVDLAVFYHPAHDHNVDRMLNAMKISLEVFSERFSPYQFHQARIIEFPRYESFAQAFAGTVPYSEAIGFSQNFDDREADQKIDLVTYVTAHEMAHQWWAHQVIGADKQGSTMLSETFAQYSALLVMEKLYGKEQLRKFMKSELDQYLRARGSEVIEELPLARVENQGYIHYRKGGLILFWLKEAVGETAVNQAMQQLVSQFAFKSAPYPDTNDFLNLLRKQVGAQHQELITDLFERITLYDMKASKATATSLPDGRFEVTFTVTGRKLYADGKGKELEANLNELFDVGVFTVEPGKRGYSRSSVLLTQRQVLKTGDQIIRLVVDKEPKVVGVDPFNFHIDRNSDDNFTEITTVKN